MRYLNTLMLCGLAALAGCSDDFLTNELDVESGARTRPFSVVCEPPDAAPGETVTVTLRCYEPHPESVDISWLLVQDFREDLYEEQEIEGEIVDMDAIATIDPMVYDEEGLGAQSFQFTVPGDVMLLTGDLDDRYDGPVPDQARALIAPANDDHVTRAELDAFLASVDPGALDPESLDWARAVSDRFACQIRLKAHVRSGIDLTVTKNLTVRYSSRFGDGNLLHNPEIDWIAVLAVHYFDLEDPDDIGDYDVDTTYVHHRDPALVSTAPIAVNGNWTYFLEVGSARAPYVSPDGLAHEEAHDYNWYYARLYDGDGDAHFLVDDSGDDRADMGALDEIVRIAPPGGADTKRIRVFAVVRNHRWEWYPYNFVPGAAYLTVPIAFASP